MGDTGWAINLYVTNDEGEDESKGFLTSFKGVYQRANDTIMTFSGLYDADDYMMWYIHKELPSYNLEDVCIELKLFLDNNKNFPFFHEKYRIHSVTYDTRKDKYVVFAVQEDYDKLIINLKDLGLTRLSFDEDRTPDQVLSYVLSKFGIMGTVFHSDPDYAFNYRYRNLTVDPDWELRDFISYICEQHSWEWTIKYGDLHFGPELKTIEKMRCFKKGDSLAENIGISPYFVKTVTGTIPAKVFGHWDEKYRVVWVKHQAGAPGGLTRCCFVRIGEGVLPRRMYAKSLEGEREANQMYSALGKSLRYSNVLLGKIITDECPDLDTVDLVGLSQKTNETSPRNAEFYDSEPEKFLENVGKTTPYLEDGAGLLFPNVENPANSLLFLVDGRIERPVVGPYVMGDGNKDFQIPEKDPGDFRLLLPNGWCLYVAEDGETILQPSNSLPGEVPQYEPGEMAIYMAPDDNIIRIYRTTDNMIEIDDEAINIKADGKIKIEAGGNVDIDASGNVTIDATGEIKLQGGANALAHASHTHTVTPSVPSVMAGPAPLTMTVGPSNSNTTKTKAD